MQVDVLEARSQFTRLLEMVERGEEVVIARAGKPVARLVPARPERKRTLGTFRNQVLVHPDFDELPPDIQASFDGEC